MQFLKAMGVAFALASVASTTEAATCSSSATFTLNDAIAAACFTGNDSNQINLSFDLFSKTGWLIADKNDDSTAGSPITFTNAPANGVKSGSWAVDSWGGYTTGNAVITLKAGNGFGAFLVDTDYASGTWSSSKDLSHASIYYQDITPVPLPASALLLFTALAGFGFVRFRR